MQIVNDTIISAGGSFDNLTPREENVREAMLVIRIFLPLIASAIIWIFSPKGWSYATAWTFNRLAIIWFLSVGIFGLWVHFQEGKTTRTTLVLAILHTQVEVLMNSLFVNLSFTKGAILAGIWGLILYPPALMVPSITIVWFMATTLGGAGDLLVFMLLAYGRRWLYAAGALAHVLGAILVFAETVIFLDYIIYIGITFIILWLHFGLITIAVLKDSPSQQQPHYIELEQGDHSAKVIPRQRLANPLDGVSVPVWAVGIMIVLGLGGAFGTAFTLNYLAGRRVGM